MPTFMASSAFGFSLEALAFFAFSSCMSGDQLVLQRSQLVL